MAPERKRVERETAIEQKMVGQFHPHNPQLNVKESDFATLSDKLLSLV